MDKRKIGFILVGGALAVWVFSYYQEKQALTAGQITNDQALSLSDRLFSPAGVAAVVGGYLIYSTR
jgi:hypothetical protein